MEQHRARDAHTFGLLWLLDSEGTSVYKRGRVAGDAYLSAKAEARAGITACVF